MTFKNKVNDIAQIKDFYTFAEALEEYAIDGIACRSPVLQEGAKRELMEKLKESPGNTGVVIYLKDMRAVKKLPAFCQVGLSEEWLRSLYSQYGEGNVKVVERALKAL